MEQSLVCELIVGAEIVDGVCQCTTEEPHSIVMIDKKWTCIKEGEDLCPLGKAPIKSK